MLQSLLIMLFRISLKNPSLCSLLFFYARHYDYYSNVPIANNTMHKCCNVKLQVVCMLILYTLCCSYYYYYESFNMHCIVKY